MQPNEKNNREIVTARVFDAPQQMMFKAWTDPEHLAQWWGPSGFTNIFHVFELKPGGLWDFTMQGPNGKGFHNQCVFIEIANPERVVFKHLLPVHEFIVTATFEPVEGNKTLTTFRMLFNTVEDCDHAKKYVVEANEQNFDRLESVITNLVKI